MNERFHFSSFLFFSIFFFFPSSETETYIQKRNPIKDSREQREKEIFDTSAILYCSCTSQLKKGVMVQRDRDHLQKSNHGFRRKKEKMMMRVF